MKKVLLNFLIIFSQFFIVFCGDGGGFNQISRAVAAYVDEADKFSVEARALHASWYSIIGPRVIIDLILFTQPNAKLGNPFDHLDCERQYTGKNLKSECFILDFESDLSKYAGATKATGGQRDYNFLKSIDFLTSDMAEKVLMDYDLVVKTDCDVVMTPGFVNWFPTVFTTGRGGYAGMAFTRQKVYEWARKFNIKHRGLFNLGASWYGRPRKVIDAARIAANFTVRLLNEAFPAGEVNEWPKWYVGVASMYGQALAINAVAPEAQASSRIDAPAHYPQSIFDVAHIHCYQGPAFFSKYKNHFGAYNGLNTTGWDTSDARVWMLEMALRGNGVKPIDSFIQITNGQDAIAWKTVNFELLKEDPPYDPRIISH